jgi:16S rRNA (guanine527-N7)-methyltransferase
MDLGSGGGSPAIPLKIVRPQLALTMVEARQRKAAFLREAARDLGLADVDVVNERFESLKSRSDLIGRYTLVTARGVRIDSNVFELAGGLLAPGGRLFLFGAQDSALAENSRFERVDTISLGIDGSSLVILTNAS